MPEDIPPYPPELMRSTVTNLAPEYSYTYNGRTCLADPDDPYFDSGELNNQRDERKQAIIEQHPGTELAQQYQIEAGHIPPGP